MNSLFWQAMFRNGKNDVWPYVLVAVGCFSCGQNMPVKYPINEVQINPDGAKAAAEKVRREVAVTINPELELSLWASDSLVTDPVAIGVDAKGGVFYTNGSRLEHSEFDIRGHREWMTASISFQSVEDRRSFLRETLAPDKSEENKQIIEDLNGDGSHDWLDLTVEKEAVWYVTDLDEDGLADFAKMYIEDFHEEVTDLANGVEYFDGNVYIAVGPDLWKTTDVDGDGIADQVESLANGFAVHIGFGAHGMSGVTVGPDGRIWWGIGDIGMNVVDREGQRWKYPNQGVIVRCEPDGSNFEVFARGLRNTHEFTWDKYGNLITEDNDGDHAGERERLVYVTNGSDGGWRINWQFGKYTDPDNNSYKVWMDEKLHVPRWEGQAAYITPPIVNYVNGPTGLVYNPGTALNSRWKDHFFVAEFRGSPANSPIHAFTLRPDGASFALDTTFEVVSGLLPTGLDFGPDGALYFADWIDGWGIKNQGRIWKLDIPGGQESAIRQEVKQLLAVDFTTKPLQELNRLLQHPDMRIRQKAQFAMVARGEEGFSSLVFAAQQPTPQIARIHAIWGIAQAARKEVKLAAELVPFLSDGDPEIQAQAAKMIGDVRFGNAGSQLIELLKHPSLRVRFFAAEALGRTENHTAVQPLIQMLIDNNDQDAWLRHAGFCALARINDPDPLIALSNHDSRAARISAVVALRRMQHPGIANFLDDQDEYVVTEAARGINDDFSIEGALPDLAALLVGTNFTGEPLIRRAINANLRVGQPANLENLKNYALRANAPIAMRAEALEALSTWAKPSVLDRVDGRYRGQVTHDRAPLITSLDPVLPSLLSSAEPISIAAMETITRLELKGYDGKLLELVRKGKTPAIRRTALQVLAEIEATTLAEALEIALQGGNEEIRSLALGIVPESALPPAKSVELFASVLHNGQIKEQQAALIGLGKINTEEASQLLIAELEKMIAGNLPPDLQLDLLEAAEMKEDPDVEQKIKEITAAYGDDPLAPYNGALKGGDAEAGRRIFYRHEAAQCVRCHSIFEWGGDAGPGLMGVGARLSSEQILESLITPSADFAEGYEVVSITLKNDEIVAGILIEETADQIVLKTGKEKTHEIEIHEIKERQTIPSAMPPVGNILTAREIRDLVAFLSSLKEES